MKDSHGNECTLDSLCRREPEWAANRIRALEATIDPVKDWYEGEGDRDTVAMLNDAIADLQQDRVEVLRLKPQKSYPTFHHPAAALTMTRSRVNTIGPLPSTIRNPTPPKGGTGVITPKVSPDDKSTNTCEHGDHPAPKGIRFCSKLCERCEHESKSDTGCDNICLGGS